MSEACTECGCQMDGKKCHNVDCVTRVFHTVVHFAKVMQIDVDDDTISELIRYGEVTTPSDLYLLSQSDDLEFLDGKVVLRDLLLSIKHSAKSVKWWRFVWSLGIQNVDEDVAYYLAWKYKNFGYLVKAEEPYVKEFFQNRHNMAMANKILCYVNLRREGDDQ